MLLEFRRREGKAVLPKGGTTTIAQPFKVGYARPKSRSVPKGRLTSNPKGIALCKDMHSLSRPFGTHAIRKSEVPNLERLGYFQSSLRDENQTTQFKRDVKLAGRGGKD